MVKKLTLQLQMHCVGSQGVFGIDLLPGTRIGSANHK